MQPVLPPRRKAGAGLEQPEPAFLWDTTGRRIVAANRAALAFWGVRSEEQLLGLRFDRAMPAALRLEQLARSPRLVPRKEALLFWLPQGRRRVACLCAPADPSAPEGQVLVRILEPGAGTASADGAFVADAEAEAGRAHVNGHAVPTSIGAKDPITVEASSHPAGNGARLAAQREAPVLASSEAAILVEIARRLSHGSRERAPEAQEVEPDEPEAPEAVTLEPPAASSTAAGPEDSTARAVAAAEPDASAVGPEMARLAHEVRTPLTAIIGFAEIMQGEQLGPMGNARYRDYASDILQSARHALGVVERLLDAARNPGGGLSQSLVRVDLASAIGACVSTMRPIAERAGVDVTIEADAALPHVIADRVGLKQMVLNLLTNAVRFAGEDGRVGVQIGYVAGGSLVVRITNTGPGMSAKAIERAMAAHSVTGTQRADGSGIGLPLTRALAEANGLALRLSSKPDEGTEACIVFPPQSVVSR